MKRSETLESRPPQNGFEDEPFREMFPTRRQGTLLVIAQQTWHHALRESNYKLGTDVPKCTDEELVELLARAWFETAVSIITCGTGTGATNLVLHQIAERHGPEKATTTRARLSAIASKVRDDLSDGGFFVGIPDERDVLAAARAAAVHANRFAENADTWKDPADENVEPLAEGLLVLRRYSRNFLCDGPIVWCTDVFEIAAAERIFLLEHGWVKNDFAQWTYVMQPRNDADVTAELEGPAPS